MERSLVLAAIDMGKRTIIKVKKTLIRFGLMEHLLGILALFKAVFR
jgi:hypothetical protein